MSFFTSTNDKSDRRGTMPPVPENLCAFLNQDQKNALRQIENFGWRLAFVRRPMFEPMMIVVESPDGGSHAVIERDGEINKETKIILRH